MTKFSATLLKFASQGEKTGWTYILIPANLLAKINPGVKTAFRVKGALDDYLIKQVALMPMGDGSFILPVNSEMRKGLGKRKGDKVMVSITVDTEALQPPADFMDCLADEPAALSYFNTLTMSHRNYFGKWIQSAKTETTKVKRMAQAIKALSLKQGFPEMLRAQKKQVD